MKRFVIVLIIVISLVGCLSEDNKESADKFEIDFTEATLAADEFFENSDVVVIGKLKKFMENKRKTMTDENGVQANMEFAVYELAVDSIISGNDLDEKTMVVFAFGKPEEIQIGKEYLFCLEQNQLDPSKYYSLISYEQAYFERESGKDRYDDTKTLMLSGEKASSEKWINSEGVEISIDNLVN